MNDFTKEELQYLHECIYERPLWVTETMDKMREKLQSLIDNYCEHETRNVLSENGMWFVEKCKKCNRVRNIITGKFEEWK